MLLRKTILEVIFMEIAHSVLLNPFSSYGALEQFEREIQNTIKIPEAAKIPFLNTLQIWCLQ